MTFFAFLDTFFHQGNLTFSCFHNEECYEFNFVDFVENHNILPNDIIENMKMSQLNQNHFGSIQFLTHIKTCVCYTEQ